MKKRNLFPLAIAAAAALACSAALADINVGVTVSATGPAASLGIPEKNTIVLMPRTIAGEKVNYIVLDDASDTTTADSAGQASPSSAAISTSRGWPGRISRASGRAPASQGRPASRALCRS